MIEEKHPDFSLKEQCDLLKISRSGTYYKPKTCEKDLLLMKVIDKQYTKTPFYRSRRMSAQLQQSGFCVGRKKVRTLMAKMGLQAIYPKPKLSISNAEHKKYPYLLRGKSIDNVDQVWSADVTYIPLHHGFGYLVAIIDWYSRYVLDWELSNLLDTTFCLEALERSLIRKSPEIFNTDQGCQFTSNAFVGKLEQHAIQISMDGRGRALDNIFVERLWRSVKYEDVYIKNYSSLKEAREGLRKYFEFYNYERLHQSLNYQTPSAIYGSKRSHGSSCSCELNDDVESKKYHGSYNLTCA